jgi:hypothetical protein
MRPRQPGLRGVHGDRLLLADQLAPHDKRLVSGHRPIVGGIGTAVSPRPRRHQLPAAHAVAMQHLAGDEPTDLSLRADTTARRCGATCMPAERLMSSGP